MVTRNYTHYIQYIILHQDKGDCVLMIISACYLHSPTVIKYFIPSFGGKSYLAFPTMSGYHTVRIAMEFRASELTGILLYNGQDGKKDFISLALVNGKVELRWVVRVKSSIDSLICWFGLMKLEESLMIPVSRKWYTSLSDVDKNQDK